MERLDKPYIGITGFTKKHEVLSALNVFPNQIDRLLMVGILASWKSLRGTPLKPIWQKQTPSSEVIKDLFPENNKALNLVHLSTGGSTLLADMLKIHKLAGKNFHGFQLNMAWPEIRSLDEYRMAVELDYRLVLQIGRVAMARVGDTPQGMIKMLYHYHPVINDILLDPSSGRGQAFDPKGAEDLLSAIADKRWGLGLGVAGGLGPDSLDLIQPLIEKFPNLNIDAQGRLRDSENDLDLNKVKTYLNKASELFLKT